MTRPTPAQPVIVNDNGTVTVLMYQGRTNTLSITHHGLTDPAGYSARAAWRDSYGGTIVAACDSDDGTATLEQLLDPDDAPIGTLITLTVSDEAMASVTASRGVWDVLVESPGGIETVVVPSSPWYLWKAVTG